MCSSNPVHWICIEVSPRDVCSTFAGTTAGYGVGVVETDVVEPGGAEGIKIEIMTLGMLSIRTVR